MKQINTLILFASAILMAGCSKSINPSSQEQTSTLTSETTTSKEEQFVGIKTLDENGQEVVLKSSEGIYNITNDIDDQEYHVYGDITDAIVFSEASTNSAKLVLHDAHISNSEVAPIQWLSGSKKVKIVAYEGENTITSTNVDTNAIRSENNCDIQGSAKLTVSASSSTVKATKICVEGSGEFNIVSSAKNGLSGKEIYLGDEDSTAYAEHTFTLNVTAAKTGIMAELNSKGNKGTVTINNAGSIVVSNAETGVLSEGMAQLLHGRVNAINCQTSYNFADTEIGEAILLSDGE